jgi:VanZ family protein
MSPHFKKFAYWFPTLIWMTLIFSFSAQPSLHASTIGWQDFVIKKSAHFTEYFILALLFDYALRHTTHFSRSKRLIYTGLFIAAYASSDELHQSFVPGRSSQIRDIMIDILGGCTGIIFHKYFSRSSVR